MFFLNCGKHIQISSFKMSLSRLAWKPFVGLAPLIYPDWLTKPAHKHVFIIFMHHIVKSEHFQCYSVVFWMYGVFYAQIHTHFRKEVSGLHRSQINCVFLYGLKFIYVFIIRWQSLWRVQTSWGPWPLRWPWTTASWRFRGGWRPTLQSRKRWGPKPDSWSMFIKAPKLSSNRFFK